MFPRLVHIYGPLWIQSYGVMISLGFLLFLYLSYNDTRRASLIDGERYLNLVFLGLIAGIIGGRLFFVFNDWQLFADAPHEIFYPWIGGFTVLGSMLGVLVMVVLYFWYYRLKILPVLDLASFYAPLMQAVGRLGCLFSGCCFGIQAPSWLPWAVTFTDQAGSGPLWVPLHPTQLYISIVALLTFVVFYGIRDYLYKPGQMFILYMMIEGVSRFTIDFLRADRGELTTVAITGYFNVYLSSIQKHVLYFFLIALGGFLWVSIRDHTSKRSHLEDNSK